LATCGVANSELAEREIWPALEKAYLWFTDRPPMSQANWQAPHKPAQLPWLSVLLLGMPVDIINAYWLADFARCLAWAWLTRNDRS
jgi:hypothetical protein